MTTRKSRQGGGSAGALPKKRQIYLAEDISLTILSSMDWRVEFHRDFVPEFRALAEAVQDEIAALAEKMRVIGPTMKRPASDTLEGSRYSNMKELRFQADNGVWRVAYAFDPARKAILLVAGDKAGISQKRFYRSLIRKADERFAEHLKELEKPRRKK